MLGDAGVTAFPLTVGEVQADVDGVLDFACDWLRPCSTTPLSCVERIGLLISFFESREGRLMLDVLDGVMFGNVLAV